AGAAGVACSVRVARSVGAKAAPRRGFVKRAAWKPLPTPPSPNTPTSLWSAPGSVKSRIAWRTPSVAGGAAMSSAITASGPRVSMSRRSTRDPRKDAAPVIAIRPKSARLLRRAGLRRGPGLRRAPGLALRLQARALRLQGLDAAERALELRARRHVHRLQGLRGRGFQLLLALHRPFHCAHEVAIRHELAGDLREDLLAPLLEPTQQPLVLVAHGPS